MSYYKQSTDPRTYVHLHQNELDLFIQKLETNEMNEIIENNLYLGTQQAAGYIFPYQRPGHTLRAAALNNLRMHNITHVVCLCGEGEEWEPFRNDRIKYLNCKLNDGNETMIEQSSDAFGQILDRAVSFIDQAIQAGGAALVHCASGAHRSASIVCGYLMIKRHATLNHVFPLLFHKRPIAYPVYWKYLSSTLEARLFTHNLDQNTYRAKSSENQ